MKICYQCIPSSYSKVTAQIARHKTDNINAKIQGITSFEDIGHDIKILCKY